MSKNLEGAESTPSDGDASWAQRSYDLSELKAHFSREWKFLAGCMLVGVIVGAILCTVIPNKYRAAAVVQIGQVPLMNGAGFELIEPVSQVLERFHLRETLSKVLKDAELPVGAQETAASTLAKTSLALTVIRSTNYVQFTVAGYSPAEAEKTATSAVNVLIKEHQKEYKETMQRLAEQLEGYKKQIAAGMAELAKLESTRNNSGATTPNGRFESNIVAVSLADAKRTELRKLQADRFLLEYVMSPTKSYPTTVIDRVFAEQSPYSPRPGPFITVSALVGLAFGAMWVWLRRKVQS